MAENARSAEDAREHFEAVLTELVELRDHCDLITEGWRGVVLARFLEAWRERHTTQDDPYWYAVGEFLATGSKDDPHASCGFDRGPATRRIASYLPPTAATMTPQRAIGQGLS